MVSQPPITLLVGRGIMTEPEPSGELPGGQANTRSIARGGQRDTGKCVGKVLDWEGKKCRGAGEKGGSGRDGRSSGVSQSKLGQNRDLRVRLSAKLIISR
jgi:hypothetical protein